MMSFKERVKLTLNEAFNVKDGKVDFKAGDGILSKFGKDKSLKPFKKKITDSIIGYSLYNASVDGKMDILTAIKSLDFNQPAAAQFINRSAVYAAKIIREHDIDVIVNPISSSQLVSVLSKNIKERTHLDVFVDSFKKNPNVADIEIDRNHPKITEAIIKSMEATIARRAKAGTLSVKAFHPQHRLFVKNLFSIVDEKTFKKVNGKRVVILDDILTSGTTIKNIADLLYEHGAAEVIALTIFKS